MVGGARREDDHAAEVLRLELGQADVVEVERVATEALADRVRDRLRLLVDLLEHEGLVAVLLGVLVVPVDLEFLPLPWAVFDRDERGAFLRDRDDLAVLDQLHAPRLAQERGDRRGEEHLFVADADDERALQPRADEHPRMLAVDDDEGEMALELRVGPGDRVGEVALVVSARPDGRRPRRRSPS